MDWEAFFSRLTNEHNKPLLPQFLGLDSMRQTLPVQDFFLEQMHRPNPGQGHIPVGEMYNGTNHDLNDQWKDMLQRRMWEQYNQRPGTQMGVNGNFRSLGSTMPQNSLAGWFARNIANQYPMPPAQPEEQNTLQMPILGRRG